MPVFARRNVKRLVREIVAQLLLYGGKLLLVSAYSDDARAVFIYEQLGDTRAYSALSAAKHYGFAF